ncbi:MAG: NAD(P)-dependent oxidoreductase [Acetobacteraceae bacterium]|nr:NAD(P)-dependent oxidoreductase [Acetobacteraceae bacterium]MSP29317.1 NAD(P)-dependent oxidoreductase [Acetobacteraceae bacterium]
MTQHHPKPILLTGASGKLGRMLTKALTAHGWHLRLTDISAFPDPLPPGAEFTRADLEDGVTILKLAEGCSTILHFGGVSTEHPFEDIIGPNIRGLYHIYEAARREQARVIFASSNHSIGFYDRIHSITPEQPFRPDGYYGLSKAYGELIGRLYWDKHDVESIFVRIGSAYPEPIDARMLATWLSYDDLATMMTRCVLAEKVTCHVIWGASNNTRMTWWHGDARDQIGWAPKDSADPFAGQMAGKVSTNAIAESHMGGAFCAVGYSRKARS